MDELTLYQKILELPPSWEVDNVSLNERDNTVEVTVRYDEKNALICPICDKSGTGYDHKERRFRHLDSCQYQTIVIADIPRVNCKQCGVHQIHIPWAERHSRFTLAFEALVIDWLLVAPVSAVARHLSLGWNTVDNIMKRAVKRGLMRRTHKPPKHINVDETSFRKRHDYVTVVSDLLGNVIHVEDGNTKDSLKGYYDTLSAKERASVESIAMDMSPAFKAITLEMIPDAENKIAFDKYHVAAYLNKAVDRVRKKESHQLHDILKGSRYLWLYNSEHLSDDKLSEIDRLQSIANKTGRAWMLKEYAMGLWHYETRGWARRAWKRWCTRALKSRLKPMIVVAKMIKENLWGIINAIVLNADNSMAESVNSRIKILKIKARGFRNKARFKTAILFHYGGLDLYPQNTAHSI